MIILIRFVEFCIVLAALAVFLKVLFVKNKKK